MGKHIPTVFGKHAPITPKLKKIILQDLFDAVVPAEEWEAIIRAQVRRAKEGDTISAKLLLEYRFGRPKQTVEVESRAAIDIRIGIYRQEEEEEGKLVEGEVVEMLPEGRVC